MATQQTNNLHELEILRQVENSPQLSNRVAASKLGVSVKLAHELLRGMVTRGLLHVSKANSRRWEYFLTPHGIREKARLTFEFLEFSLDFYREARRRSAQACKDLHLAGVEQVALLGSGDLAEIVYLGIQEWKLALVEVFDPEPGGTPFMGIPVQPLDSLPQSTAAAVIVCLYDARQPMRNGFLPPGVTADKRFHWVFEAPIEEQWTSA